MKISGFTFIKNGEILGYPFIESIKSILSLVDEFVVNVGESEDSTLELIEKIDSPKIRILKSSWCENMQQKGYVYGQQKMIAQFNCTGDWAFYLEGDEVLHEDDLNLIAQTMEKYKDDHRVEAIAFDYLHFYGNKNTFMDSPAWYRSEVRAIKTNIRSYAPDGLFWVVLDGNNKCGRYPNAVKCGARVFHYGWVRPQEKMTLKHSKVAKYWKHKSQVFDYTQVDSRAFRFFDKTHPSVMKDFLGSEDCIFVADPNYRPNKRERRHSFLMRLEKLFGLDFSKKHYKLLHLS